MPKLKCKLCHDSLWINLGILTVYGKPYVSDITVCARNRPIFNGSALHIFHDKRHPDIMSEPEISRFLSHLASTARYRHQLRIKPCQHFCFCTRMFWNNNSTGLRMLCMQNCLVAYRLFFNTCRGYVTACRNTWCQRPYCPPAVRYRHATDGVSEVAHQGYRHSTSSDTRALGEGGTRTGLLFCQNGLYWICRNRRTRHVNCISTIYVRVLARRGCPMLWQGSTRMPAGSGAGSLFSRPVH